MGKSLRSVSRSGRLLFASFNLLRLYPTPQLHGGSRSLETLAYEEIRIFKRPFYSTAFILHGLLGSARNWRTFSRNLASELQKSSPLNEWRMVLTDLRNHGRSAGIKGFDPPHDMANAARDLANLVKSQEWDWPDVVIGHSLGGKVALEYAASCARGDYGESAVLPKQ
ncbi:protein phosphatase methylesterase 1-like, partial [Phalaenopsis equestris]|uniref:protein phosphatase methylesterase 1-like n=1 Tax=Phalaenopsis equestris TaxID=78828 RepID=UPI0009E6379B